MWNCIWNSCTRDIKLAWRNYFVIEAISGTIPQIAVCNASWIVSSWKGGAQSKLKSRSSELIDKSKYSIQRDLRGRFWRLYISCNEFEDTSKLSSCKSGPILLRNLPFKWLLLRFNFRNEGNNIKSGDVHVIRLLEWQIQKIYQNFQRKTCWSNPL